MKPRTARAALILVLLVAAAAVPGSALSITELDGNVSSVFIGSNAQPVSQYPGWVDPSMTVAPLIGVSVPLRLSGPLFIEPGIEFLGTFYDWTGSGAQITNSDSGFGFFTVGVLLSMQAGVSLAVSPVISIGAAAGLDLLVRFPLELQNTGSTVQGDESNALGWFYGAARFIYPETRLFLRWHIMDPLDLVFNVRGFYPVFHLWDGSGQPFWDSLMVSAGIGFAVRLGKPAAPAGTAPAFPASPAPETPPAASESPAASASDAPPASN